jgi:transposase
MPSGLIDEDRGMCAWRDLRGDFGQVKVHRLGVATRHDERGAFAFLRTDRAENVGRGGPLVVGGAWARAALGPTAGDLVLLPDPRLVGEPEFYRAGIDALLAPDLFQARGEAYGMARPSFRRRRVAGGSGGGMGMDIAVLGVDLGKNVCSVVGLDPSGAVVMRRKVRRETLIALAEKLPPCVVGMEACCGAHHVGRVYAAHGHDVRLMSPEYVRPYVKAQKNDDRDAEGIAEAATRPTMRFVELKSQDQLDMQTLHRSRDRLVGERTALINQLRAILLERGYVAPQGKRKLEQFLSVLMDEQGGADLSPRIALLVADARAQWAELDRRISAFDAEFIHWVKENKEARRLTTIPGIGAIVASAIVAAVGRAESFDRGRDLAAWLGLVPRQFTTGGKPKLLGISKRGNKYLRRQLIHGARAALPYVAERDTPLGRWAKGLLSRAHHNVAVVAYANKLARIAWAVLRRGERFAVTGMPLTA